MKIFKIVVTGPYNAGKTTLIKTICSEALTTDRKVSRDDLVKSTTTVALDFGLIRIGNHIVRLFGTPGQSRFQFMWRTLSIGMDGYLFMVDSSDPVSLNDALHMYMFFRSMHPSTVHVIAANKYDKEKKLSLDIIRSALKVPELVPIYPTIAYNRDSVFNVLEALITLIQNNSPITVKHTDPARNI
ncbi:MAG: GTP-binding protein [Thaumarchaeota archaeon]|jgi:small GTP-binding protein|nr:GTP-binding protein [Candidatus Geocrenenecus arthurdayi]MCL7391215.1 GTP-binding protein [Candidatus Geocrenenecus arthurdayi]